MELASEFTHAGKQSLAEAFLQAQLGISVAIIPLTNIIKSQSQNPKRNISSLSQHNSGQSNSTSLTPFFLSVVWTKHLPKKGVLR